MKEIYYRNIDSDKAFNGVEKLAKAVGTTLGPCGGLVIINKDSPAAYQSKNTIVTKDGVTVAKEFMLPDPIENAAAKVAREAASKTNDEAGDGTTTATVLGYSILKEGRKVVNSGYPAPIIKRGIEKASELIKEEIQKHVYEVTSDSLKDVATISANGDKEMGELVANLFEEVGKTGTVTVEESKTSQTTTRVTDGAEINRGYLDARFVNDSTKRECVLENVGILITDDKLENANAVSNIMSKIYSNKNENGWFKSFLVISNNMSTNVLALMCINTQQEVLSCCAIECPAYGERRTETLKDIAVLTGGIVFSTKEGNPFNEDAELSNLGRADKVVIKGRSTIIIDGKGNKDAILKRADEIQQTIDNFDAKTDQYIVSTTKERLARLTGGIGVIEVGGITESDVKEKKYRIEDTVASVKAALEAGIVAGGGTAIIHAAQIALSDEKIKEAVSEEDKVSMKLLREAVTYPLKVIVENSGLPGDLIVEKVRENTSNFDYGYDAYNREFGNMIEKGIIDPAKVTIQALTNAITSACMILTSGCVMAEIGTESKK